MTIYLPVGSALYVDTSVSGDTPTWTKLSEHNREPISLDPNRIEKTQRMSNGTLRKIFIADKRNLGVSWAKLPTYNSMTIDGGMGKQDLHDFYLGKGKNTFKVKISYNGTREDIFTVSFTNFSSTLVNRNVKSKTSDTPQEFWSVNIALEEV